MATIEDRVIRNEESMSEHGERLSAIDAVLSHLATKADMKALESKFENKLLSLKNKLLWVGIGITTALVVNILMTLLRYIAFATQFRPYHIQAFLPPS